MQGKVRTQLGDWDYHMLDFCNLYAKLGAGGYDMQFGHVLKKKMGRKRLNIERASMGGCWME